MGMGIAMVGTTAMIECVSRDGVPDEVRWSPPGTPLVFDSFQNTGADDIKPFTGQA